MSKNVALLLVLVFLTASCVITSLPVKAGSRTFVVPDDYPTIATAIGKATDGDTIHVKRGTYEEHSLVINKTLTLIGEDKNSTTIKNIDEPPPWDMVNPFPPPKPDAIQISADDSKISGFTITSTSKGIGATTKGISATGKGIQIIGNIIKELTGAHSATGIDVYGERNQIIGNTVLGAIDGVSVSGSYQTVAQNIIERGSISASGQYNIIAGNTVSKGYTGGIDLSGDFNVVYNNTITDQNKGISVYGVGNIISKNNASNNSLFGIEIGAPTDNLGNNSVCANIIAHNNRYGVFILEGQNNTVYANYIANNQIGISVLWYEGWMDHSAFNNTFYHNNFVGNGQEAADWSWPGTNSWDNGAEGNYWSDCNGTDANGDGIGDTFYTVNSPYTINYNSGPILYDPKIVNTNEVFDRYPFMFPFDIDNVSIKLPDWAVSSLNPSPKLIPSEPFPTALAVGASGVSVAIVGLGLLVYFKKHRH